MSNLLVIPASGAITHVQPEWRAVFAAELYALGVSPEARRIAAQQEVAWNALLFVQVVADEVAQCRKDRELLTLNWLPASDPRSFDQVPDLGIPTWFGDRIQELITATESVQAPVAATNRAFVEFADRTGAQSVAPLVEAAREWGGVYRRYLAWAFRARFTPLPALWLSAQSKLRDVVTPVLSTIGSAGIEWRRAIKAGRDARLAGGEPRVNISLQLQHDDVALRAAVEDFRRTADVVQLLAAFRTQPG